MKLFLFEQICLDITNAYRAGMKLPPLKKQYMAESDEFLYADEDEPDRYPDEDNRLDSEVHDQCVGGKFKE